MPYCVRESGREVIGLVLVTTFLVSSGTTSDINRYCTEQDSQDCFILRERNSLGSSEMPKARGIKEIATAHMQREG